MAHRALRLAASCPLLLPLIACRATEAPPSPKSPVTIPTPSEPATESPPAAAESTARCPSRPLKLLVRAPGQPPMTMLSLDASGEVSVTSFGASLRATLDPDGCLVGPDGLWAERSPGGTLWTAHERFQVEGEKIRLPEGTIGIRPDGAVERSYANGTVDAGTLSFDGYREEARCAAELLLVTFFAMMPSMAVSDGNPPLAPVPADTTCGKYRRPGTG